MTAVAAADTEDFSEVLERWGLAFEAEGYHLRVGAPRVRQGWILHISVVIWQVGALLERVLPVLAQEGVPFKIPRDRGTADHLLTGAAGLTQLGKVVCVYPGSEGEALRLAPVLVEVLADFKGPRVLTDVCLGGVVYTRYGSFERAVVSERTGKEEKFVWDVQGCLTPDTEPIPFVMPAGRAWPFEEMGAPQTPKRKGILHQVYKTIHTIKVSPRGNVWIALYNEGFLRLRRCVIKHGAQHMGSDYAGRDIADRLRWQWEVHRQLSGKLLIPKVFDLFTEEGDTYLAMEWIEGESLYDRIMQINYNFTCWFQFSAAGALAYLDYLLGIVRIVGTLHAEGFVHRDLAPGNFIVDKQGRLYLIDIELAYSLREERPLPPFGLGTPGFMSPEQLAMETPTVKEDIYGLGSLMVAVFTGMSPAILGAGRGEGFFEVVDFFIRDADVSEMICRCLSLDPALRPDLETVGGTLAAYRERIERTGVVAVTEVSTSTGDGLQTVVQEALMGLGALPTVMKDGIWYSKLAKADAAEMVGAPEFVRHAGLYEGLSGVLYGIARAVRCGFDVGALLPMYAQGWDYIEETFVASPAGLGAGLYRGMDGVAMAMAEGVAAGLLEDGAAIRQRVGDAVSGPVNGVSLASGTAGRIVARMHCQALLGDGAWSDGLEGLVAQLTETQRRDGSWRGAEGLGFGEGVSGMGWTLLEYGRRFGDSKARMAGKRAVDLIVKRTDGLKKLFDRRAHRAMVAGAAEGGEIRTGIILAVVKAYECLREERYRTLAERALEQFPPRIVNISFVQHNGLAGLGELYLEAWRVFDNREWLERAAWIAEVLARCTWNDREGRRFWMLDETYTPTADLMVGSGGILHFLMRCLYPEKLGYRLLT